MQRYQVKFLPFCFITYNHNCAQCTTGYCSYMCSMFFPIKYYIHYSELCMWCEPG